MIKTSHNSVIFALPPIKFIVLNIEALYLLKDVWSPRNQNMLESLARALVMVPVLPSQLDSIFLEFRSIFYILHLIVHCVCDCIGGSTRSYTTRQLKLPSEYELKIRQ